MSTRDFTANVISATKVVPDGNFKDSKASGVWDINEALDLIKGGNWPNAANINSSAFVDALFQTHLYAGTSGSLSINNGIDLSKGGLVWFKDRNYANNHRLYDTARGVRKYLDSSATAAEATNSGSGNSNGISAFNSNGFTIGNDGYINDSSSEYVSWTFRKQPKFFDIQTWTGNGTNRTISHNLGSVPGMIIVRNLANGYSWQVYHRSMANTERMELDNTGAKTTGATTYWNSTTATSSEFSIGTQNQVNNNGDSFIAYIFAHNNDDGGFGEPGDQDIIKCGDFTTDGSENATVTLGFEPQWVLWKPTGSTSNWHMFDAMRGMPIGQADALLEPDGAGAEVAGVPYISPTPTGFSVTNMAANKHVIFMAIRRGGMQTPTAASDVFGLQDYSGTPSGGPQTGFVTDLALLGQRSGGNDKWYIGSRLLGTNYLNTESTASESSNSNQIWDRMDGAWNGNVTGYMIWGWARARGFFDVVAYSGTGSGSQNVSHNLGVVPEMMWIKVRSDTDNWTVYHSALGNTKRLMLNSSDGESSANEVYFNNTTPTSSVFTAGTLINASQTYVAYLFATVAGVSKVGTYTGDGSAGKVIDCGFTNGTKFVIIKELSDSHKWFVYDTTRGISSGNDPYLWLNTSDAENDQTDSIDPHSSGFAVNYTNTNSNGETYIFYAIATDPS